MSKSWRPSDEEFSFRAQLSSWHLLQQCRSSTILTPGLALFCAFCFELFCHQKGVSYFIFLNFRGVPLPAPHREGLSFMNTAACLGLAFPFFSTMTIVEIPHNGRCHRPCDALMFWRGRLRYRTSFDAKSWQAPQTLLGSPAMVGVSGAHALRMNSRGTPGLDLVDVIVRPLLNIAHRDVAMRRRL